MDRGHRKVLRLGAVVALSLALAGGETLSAQQPSTPNPTAPVTPSVQAPPAQASVTPTPTPKLTPTPAPKPTATPTTPSPAPATPKPTPVRTPSPAPSASPKAGDTTARMQQERERELNQSQGQGSALAFNQRPQNLPRDEQTTFEINERIWNKMLPEEQQTILGQAGRRIREETEQAYAQSGLGLNDDQREVFALRYRQERRRLERELQEKANSERNRRVPLILEQLKREFGRLTAPDNGNGGNGGGNNGKTPKVSTTPGPAAASTPPPSPSAAVNAAAGPQISPAKTL